MAIPANWEIRRFDLPVDYMRFRYLEYCLNRRALREIARGLKDVDQLISYGFEAPALLSGFTGPRIYMLRDEYGLGWMRNYAGGLARFAYGLYILLELIPRLIWKRDLGQNLPHIEVLANSEYMARCLRREFVVGSVRVVLPEVDFDGLKLQYESALPQISKRGVVFVGDNLLKGVDIVIRIARALPEQQFYIFARKKLKGLPENVEVMSWANSGVVYAHADAIIVPSRWHEAYGRIVAEAIFLGLPTITSDRGGLTEAGAGRTYVVSDLEDIPEWVSQIALALNSR